MTAMLHKCNVNALVINWDFYTERSRFCITKVAAFNLHMVYKLHCSGTYPTTSVQFTKLLLTVTISSAHRPMAD